MLMFESSIFASFIPQIIMVLGYLSCVFGPQFLKSTQQAEISPTTIEHVQVESKQIPNSVVEYQFFQDIYVDNQVNNLVSYPEIRQKVFFTLTGNFVSSYFTFQLFSRPPPFFC